MTEPSTEDLLEEVRDLRCPRCGEWFRDSRGADVLDTIETRMKETTEQLDWWESHDHMGTVKALRIENEALRAQRDEFARELAEAAMVVGQAPDVADGAKRLKAQRDEAQRSFDSLRKDFERVVAQRDEAYAAVDAEREARERAQTKWAEAVSLLRDIAQTLNGWNYEDKVMVGPTRDAVRDFLAHLTEGEG